LRVPAKLRGCARPQHPRENGCSEAASEAGTPGGDIMVDEVPFWRAKRLEEMNEAEW
jgi:hypothetical protein